MAQIEYKLRWVVPQDEPYSNEVIATIIHGENEKERLQTAITEAENYMGKYR